MTALGGGSPARWRGLSLDVGGTLIEPWPSVGHVYAAVAREFGAVALEPQRLTAAFGQAWQGRSDFDYSRDAWRLLVEQSFAGAQEPAEAFRISDACFAAIYRRFGEASAWRVFEDVRPSLQALRQQGIPIVLVSNWDERLRPLLAELELTPLVTDMVISHEVGAPKPQAAIFREAIRRLGLAPNEVLHVGDSRSEDFEGAQAAGLQARWLRRGPGGSGNEAGQIRTLAQLTIG